MTESTPKLCECGCGEPTTIARQHNPARGWVKGEGRRFLRGHNNRPVGYETPEQRLRRETMITDTGCWIWTGAKTSSGYGSINMFGRSVGAHVFSYEIFKGPLPVGYEIHHACETHACVNPDHLEARTHLENVRLAGPNWQAQKTHCKHGHPLSGDNLYVTTRGYRNCRICMNASSKLAKRRWRQRKKETHAAVQSRALVLPVITPEGESGTTS